MSASTYSGVPEKIASCYLFLETCQEPKNKNVMDTLTQTNTVLMFYVSFTRQSIIHHESNQQCTIIITIRGGGAGGEKNVNLTYVVQRRDTIPYNSRITLYTHVYTF